MSERGRVFYHAAVGSVVNRVAARCCLVLLLGQWLAAAVFSAERPVERLDVASFASGNQLLRPNIDEWIFLGSSVGHGYTASGAAAGRFSVQNPGYFQVVHIEPQAYRYFKQHRRYANGTMLSLSFYRIRDKPAPAIDGWLQGELASVEIHLLDKTTYVDKRAFFRFDPAQSSAAAVAVPNSCIRCHQSQAHFDGTFSDFYPLIRQQLSDHNRQ